MSLRFVLVTLDHHLAGALARARAELARELPGVELLYHVASDWSHDPAAAERCRADIARGDIIAVTQLFSEEQASQIAGALEARRDGAKAVFCALCAAELMRLTRLGRFSMREDGASSQPWSPLSLLRKLRGERKDGRSSGERQMAVVRRLPQLLRFVPGTAQDVRAYFLALQYWLSGSDTNIAGMVRLLVHRYGGGKPAKQDAPPAPEQYPEVGLYHPSLPGRHMTERRADVPAKGKQGTVGLLLGRSYLLAGNTAHYDAVITSLEQRGLSVVPAFASALDSRPALERFFLDAHGAPTIDALLSLTGFSLVGGPAYNDSPAAREALAALDVPYLCAQPLEFQTIADWTTDPRGLNPLQATLQVAIPELDGATQPLVFAGKREGAREAASEAIAERVEVLSARLARLVALRRAPRAERRVAITLFNFPPNAGNTGSAAYLDVFGSLQRTLAALKEAGYTVELPESVEALRERITEGNRMRHGTPANVIDRIPADVHVRRERHLADIERTWGPAPGRQLSDGGAIFVMGERFGNVFVGVQPAFGWEGDPMRLLFEGNFAPTHAFAAYYTWLREDFGAHVVLHFGTHGALEFMPGKQVGLGGGCWPERLIGDLPNVYLYASNNSSEGTLAKRRGGATLVSYLTPPVSNAGLYRGLAELKTYLERHRSLPPGVRAGEEGEALVRDIQERAVALELATAEPAWASDDDAPIVALRARMLELEYALIPTGLHVVGTPPSEDERIDTLLAIARSPRPDVDLPSLPEAIARPGEDAEALASDAAVDAAMRDAITVLVRSHVVRDAARHLQAHGRDGARVPDVLEALRHTDALLREDHELHGILRALDARFVPPAPGGDLVRNPAVLPTGRNLYGFDPYRVPSAFALKEGRSRAELLLRRAREDGEPLPESVAFVLWGTDNMKSDGVPIAQALALMGAVPRFDGVGRLCGARLVPLEQLGRPRIDVVLSVSGIFRDLLPLQIRLLAEAALLAAQADEPEALNFVRRHALAAMRETGCDVETAALRVFGNADGAYGSNVNLLVDSGRWEREDELADLFATRKGFAYGTAGKATAAPQLLKRSLAGVSVSFQNIDSVELGATDIDQYVESFGGLNRLITQQRGEAATAYMGDFTGPSGKVRTLAEQVELETRTRLLNPKWFEAQLKTGYEGARNLAGHVTTTLGWSATTQSVPQWVYREVAGTFVLDAAMRERLAQLNPSAAVGMANRLLEATDRGYWAPDPETLEALREAAADLEDRLEGITAG